MAIIAKTIWDSHHSHVANAPRCGAMRWGGDEKGEDYARAYVTCHGDLVCHDSAHLTYLFPLLVYLFPILGYLIHN